MSQIIDFPSAQTDRELEVFHYLSKVNVIKNDITIKIVWRNDKRFVEVTNTKSKYSAKYVSVDTLHELIQIEEIGFMTNAVSNLIKGLHEPQKFGY